MSLPPGQASQIGSMQKSSVGLGTSDPASTATSQTQSGLFLSRRRGAKKGYPCPEPWKESPVMS